MTASRSVGARTQARARVRGKLTIESCALYPNCRVVRPPKGWKFVAVDMCRSYAHLRLEVEKP